MDKKQLLALFAISLSISTVGSSMGALLPVNAARLGTNPDGIGLYMAGVYIGLASGVLTTGWLSNRLKRRKTLLIIAGTLAMIAYWGMGLAANMAQLAPLTILATYVEGMQIVLINILAGLHAGPAERGRVFGLLGSGTSLGALISGLAGGIVNRWGFPGFFSAVALVTLLQPLIALLITDKAIQPAARGAEHAGARRALFSRAFGLLFLASVVVFAMSDVFGLTRSLGMNKAGFDPSAILSTVVISGLITLPIPLAMGWLSDRIGRRPLLFICYVAGAAALFGLAIATKLWQFWVASAVQSLVGASMGIGSAMVTDLVPPEALSSGLSLFNGTMWIGLIVGSALAGTAIQRLGFSTTLFVSIPLALLSIFLIMSVRQSVPQVAIKPGS